MWGRGTFIPTSVKNQRFLPASPQGEAFGAKFKLREKLGFIEPFQTFCHSERKRRIPEVMQYLWDPSTPLRSAQDDKEDVDKGGRLDGKKARENPGFS